MSTQVELACAAVGQKMNHICSICIEPLGKRFKLKKCKHRFHANCLKQWTAIGKRRTNCPVCRSSLCTVDKFKLGVFDTRVDADDDEWKSFGNRDLRLGWAARNGDVASVTRLIGAGHRLEVDGYTDWNEHVSAMQDSDFDDSDDDDDESESEYAGALECEEFFYHGPEAREMSDRVIFTPVVEAVGGGNVEVLRLLLDAGAPIDQDAFMAACWGMPKMLELFLDAPPQDENKIDDPKRTANIGDTPLSYAIRNGCITTVKLLLDRGADVEAKTGKDNFLNSGTPLCVAAGAHNLDIFKLLLERGADVASHGNTPLLSAAFVDSYYYTDYFESVPAGGERRRLLWQVIKAKRAILNTLLADPRVDRDAICTDKSCDPKDPYWWTGLTATQIARFNLKKIESEHPTVLWLAAAVVECLEAGVAEKKVAFKRMWVEVAT